MTTGPFQPGPTVGTSQSSRDAALLADRKEVRKDENIYFKGIAGMGWRWNDNNLSARFSQKIRGANTDYPSATIYQIDIVFSRILSFQKMRKGYKIYLD